MAIPESQLETWAKQGSITQSSSTYKTIKTALEDSDTPYAGKNFKVFLQGSYGNDTNVYADSDVDVVIVCQDCFHSDLSDLTEEEKKAHSASFSNADYTFYDFKKDVLATLTKEFGSAAKAGGKAIYLPEDNGRRNADVLVAVEYRRYYKFRSTYDQSYAEGICFFNTSGSRIANFPKQHSANCTVKHGSTNKWFKPVVRIFKNARNKMIEDGTISSDLAPSYFLEGLLYNVPNDKFADDYEGCMVNCINWLMAADRSQFVCVNEQYYLLRDSLVTWPASNCTAFLNALVKLWNEW